jgi:predicted O-methyltransferase YrrM
LGKKVKLQKFMYSGIQLAFKYLAYYFSASNGKGHGIHSPFVFDFTTHVLNDSQAYPDYSSIEKLRAAMLADKGILTVKDFGAGSSVSNNNQRSIASIAANAVKPRKYGQLLFRMVNKYRPGTILELGSSLGITSSYLALGNPQGKMITLEGADEVAQVARQNFQQLGLSGIEMVPGDFQQTLPKILSGLDTVDFVFVDGNHRKEPTLQYFNQLLPKTNPLSILVFDDIHWSREMEEAWEIIKSHPAVRCSIDLFFVGLIFFREEFREKQDFIIRF